MKCLHCQQETTEEKNNLYVMFHCTPCQSMFARNLGSKEIFYHSFEYNKYVFRFWLPAKHFALENSQRKTLLYLRYIPDFNPINAKRIIKRVLNIKAFL